MDQYSSDSSLPWLDVVLFCLDGVGLNWVSLAAMYLYKPQRTAVAFVSMDLNIDVFQEVSFTFLKERKAFYSTFFSFCYFICFPVSDVDSVFLSLTCRSWRNAVCGGRACCCSCSGVLSSSWKKRTWEEIIWASLVNILKF